MEIEFRSDNEEENDDEELDSDDDEMPDLISSPSNAKKSSARAKAPAAASGSAFPVRKVRFGNIVAEDLVDENGIVRDGYDYTQHMREMGKGKFYSADGQFSSQSELARRVELPADVLPSAEEQDRLLDAITLTTDLMDEDLREALVNDEAFEEIDDDFMTQAAVVDPEEVVNDGFDYDAHIAKLMEAASGVPKFRGKFDDEEDDDDSEFDSEDDEDSDDYEIDEASKAEEQRVLDALFEKTLAEEYDDEQLGELEEDDPETRGKLVLEGELLDAIVEDFVTVRLEMLNDEGKIGNPLRTGNRLKEIIEECAKEREDAEALAEAEGGDTMPEDDDDGVDLAQALKDLYVRNSYLTAREEEQWDCESIVSTYSNLDNHPTILKEENVNKRKKKRSALANMDHDALVAAAYGISNKTIVLSKKTGMPLGVFETAKKEMEAKEKALAAAEAEAMAQLSKRERTETKEEKKVRKEAVKQLKNQRRQEKKQWKNAFKDEEQRQLGLTPGGKVSIFKY